jgi:tRNA (guanine10-N2)-methyltransferase
MVVELENHEAALKILSRAILIREIIELYTRPAVNFGSLRDEMENEHSHYWKPFLNSTFKFDVDSYGLRFREDEKLDLINAFSFCNLQGEIKMLDPEVVFTLRTDYKTWYFGRLVGNSRRDLMERFNLKKRAYLGITSFEAELSLVMSNLALVGPGSLALDPFVGTGSFLYTTSAFGAYSIGSDIDGRQLRGTSDCNFYENLKQYRVEKFVLGGLIQDIKHHAFRDGFKVHAIVTDPPYGVRAGAKMIGGFDPTKPHRIPDDKAKRATRYPKTVPYEMAQLVADLYDFGARFLMPKGRLMFWYPVDRNQRFDPETMMPRDPRYEFVCDCLQKCRDFDRWLVVAELK